MAGDLSGSEALSGFGRATAASPAPKVFSAIRGYETYSTRFTLSWRTKAGAERELELTPERYSRIRGPYNRRNVYGAVVAYAPVLASDRTTEPMVRSVARYAVTGAAPLLAELGADPTEVEGPVRLRFTPRSGATMGPYPATVEVKP